MADKAMVELDGKDMLGRPVKIRPGVVKSASERSQQQQQQQGDGSPRPNRNAPFSVDQWRRGGDVPAPALPRTNSDSSRRLYVGGLPRLTDAEEISSNMTQFFQGYDVYVDISSAVIKTDHHADIISSTM